MVRALFPFLLALLIGLCGVASVGAPAAASAPSEEAGPPRPHYPGAPGIFVPMGLMTFPVIRDGRIRGRLSIDIVIEVAPDRDHRSVMDSRRRIEDAFNTEMNVLLGLKWPDGMSVDLEIARQRLLERARRIAGREVVAGVYFQWVQDRRS